MFQKMLNLNKRSVLALMACLALFAVAHAPARAADSDDLTADQKARLRSVMESARKDTDELYGRMRQARRQLSQQYDSYNLDERKINESMRWINRIQSDILRRHLRTQQEIRRIVNPAQFVQIRRMMNEMRDRGRGERGGRGRGRRHGPPPGD